MNVAAGLLAVNANNKHQHTACAVKKEVLK
jgi:hypothetical protein